MADVLDNKGLAVFYIFALGIGQMLVHMIYFLHMNTKSEGGWFNVVTVLHGITGGYYHRWLTLDHVSLKQQYDAKHVVVISRRQDSFKKSSLTILLAVLPVIVVLILLGTWQVQRLGWKQALIERVQSRAQAEPVAAPLNLSSADMSPEEFEYLRVSVSGYFLHELQTRVQTTTEQGAGYWLMTPFKTQDSIIFINRGFVPESYNDQTLLESANLQEQVSLTGLLRLDEPKGQLLRDNVPEEKSLVLKRHHGNGE